MRRATSFALRDRRVTLRVATPGKLGESQTDLLLGRARLAQTLVELFRGAPFVAHGAQQASGYFDLCHGRGVSEHAERAILAALEKELRRRDDARERPEKSPRRDGGVAKQLNGYIHDSEKRVASRDPLAMLAAALALMDEEDQRLAGSASASDHRIEIHGNERVVVFVPDWQEAPQGVKDNDIFFSPECPIRKRGCRGSQPEHDAEV